MAKTRVVSKEGSCSREIQRHVQTQKKKKKAHVHFDNWLEMNCEMAKQSRMTSGTSGLSSWAARW